MKHLDPVAGSWTYDLGPAGKAFSPARPRLLPLAGTVFTLRQLRGEIPWNHPMSSLAPGDWGDVFHHVLPPERLWKPLSADETARARTVAATPGKEINP